LGYTLINLSDSDVSSKRSYWKLWVVGIFVVGVVCFLHWGGYLLEAHDSVPPHVDAAVVLQGSVASEKARVAAAMALLQQGSAGRVALSVPKKSYWDEEVPPIARQYLEKNYGAGLAGKVDFCETDADVNSTEQEAQALSSCLQEHGWKTIALVTSNYQSRRAEMIWRKTVTKRDPSMHLSVDGVADPEYQARGWWRQRLYAKIWFLEFTKLVWAVV
jgi:uncharacterized SAM-binding protein YcdF (DUF218 family)